MKISQIIVNESDVGTTTSGVIAPVSETVGKVNVRGLEPAANVMKGKAKKKGPYANSLSEGKKMAEARVDEEDKIIAPGMGRKLKPGFHKIDPDKAEREGETLKNSLHTIIRAATDLDKRLSNRDNFPEWVSEKIGATKGMMVSVMDYLISQEEMKRDSDAMDECGGVIAGGEQYESKLDELSRKTVSNYVKAQPERIKGNPEKGIVGLARTNPEKAGRIVDKEKGDIRRALTKLKDPTYGKAEPKIKEGAKVDRMIGHIAQSERKAGESKKEARNIAWATANKRGMLNNKNKKK